MWALIPPRTVQQISDTADTAAIVLLCQTSSSAVVDKAARRAASRLTAKFIKQSRDHDHALLLVICHPVA